MGGVNFHNYGIDFGAGMSSSPMADKWYGVQIDESQSTPDCLRIGQEWLHKSLPVQSAMRRCLLLDDGIVNYYLSETDSTLKADNVTPAVLDGTDGQVMVEIPEHWVKVTKDGSVITAQLSAVRQPLWRHVTKYYISAYEATIDRTNSKLASVVNLTAQYRGGNNSSTHDNDGASLLGKPASASTMATFRTDARNRGASGEYKWNQYTWDAHCDLYWLYTIEYATRNSQKAVNASLDANGYRQGGLGNGVSNLTSAKWNAFNSYYPFVPCGYTNSLGNATGEKAMVMPFEYDAGMANYAGEYDAETECTADKYYSSGDLLYKCILTNTGEALTDTTYFTAVTRTTTMVNSYRGIENPFGHIFKWADGIKFNQHNIYICSDRSKYSSASAGTDYDLKGVKCSTDGYAKQMFIGTDLRGDIVPTAVGGGTTTYYCDYYYQANTPTTWYAAALGGFALYGANDGLSSLISNSSVSSSVAYYGSRLCFYPS